MTVWRLAAAWTWPGDAGIPPDHRAHDATREGEGGGYPPMHDTQALVDGDAARALAEIVHDRWHRATNHSLPWSTMDGGTWPASLMPDATNVHVGITRTDTPARGA